VSPAKSESGKESEQQEKVAIRKKMHISELLSFHIHTQHPLVELVPVIVYESHQVSILFDNIYQHPDIGSSYISFSMYDGDCVGATSSPSDPQSGSKYTDHTWSLDAERT